MGVLADLLDLGKEVLTLTHRVESLQQELGSFTQETRQELRQLDRRLARIEVLIELAQQRRLGPGSS